MTLPSERLIRNKHPGFPGVGAAVLGTEHQGDLAWRVGVRVLGKAAAARTGRASPVLGVGFKFRDPCSQGLSCPVQTSLEHKETKSTKRAAEPEAAARQGTEKSGSSRQQPAAFTPEAAY